MDPSFYTSLGRKSCKRPRWEASRQPGTGGPPGVSDVLALTAWEVRNAESIGARSLV